MAQETPAQEANIAPVNEKVGESNVTTGDDTTVEKPTNGFVGEENGLGQEKRDRIGRLGALPIEELVYHANLQRRAYGVGSATSSVKREHSTAGLLAHTVSESPKSFGGSSSLKISSGQTSLPIR